MYRRSTEVQGITLVADPKELRRIVKFLSHTADAMAKYKGKFCHEHFYLYEGRGREISPGPDISVVNPSFVTEERTTRLKVRKKQRL